jgi:hypothetical protein
MPASPNSSKSSVPNASRASSRASTSAPSSPRNTRPSLPSAPAPLPASDGRCQHLRADGKRCASVIYPGHATLCHYHLSRQMRGISDADTIAADILSSVGNFQSASAINIALGKLFVHQITGRILRQEAIALAYTCQLLLQTLPAVKAELQEGGYFEYWCEETERILSRTSDLEDLTTPSLLPDSSLPLCPPDHIDSPAPAAGKVLS